MPDRSQTPAQRAAIAAVALITPKTTFAVRPVECDGLLVGHVEGKDVAALETASSASAASDAPYVLTFGPAIRGGRRTGLAAGLADVATDGNVRTITTARQTVRMVTNDVHDHVAIQDRNGEIVVEIDAVDALVETLQAIRAVHLSLRRGG